MSSYVELHAASAFSFLQGASLPETLVDRAAACGCSAMALLDRDGVYGTPRFHKAALTAGIKPIVGAELTIVAEAESLRSRPRHNSDQRRSVLDTHEGYGPSASGLGVGPQARKKSGVPREQAERDSLRSSARHNWLLPVLCESQEGYRNLCRLISHMKMRAPKGEGGLALEEFEGMTRGLVVLAGRALLNADRFGVGGLLDRLIGLFGREQTFVELQRHCRRDEEADNQLFVEMAAAFHVPVIVTNGVRFATPADRPLFDVLTCLHHHTDLASAGRRLAPNAERYLKPPEDMSRLFSDMPHAIARTAELADRLQYTLADLGYRFPDYPVPPGETQSSFLRGIAEVGARTRYRPYHERARAQVARELDLIEKLDLSGYFLIVWDIVNFCRQHDILVQGRGSAANSAVCYSLGITAVDPVGMDLLFERFLSEERGEWPDIDLDLPSGDRREKVIQHVYEKYGRLGAAMTANVITYRGRSAAREVGKVLGFPPADVDRLAKVMNNFEFVDPSDTLPRHLTEVGLDLGVERVRLFARLWREAQDLPRHLGQHSGGMVICQGRLDSVVPLENATMPGRVVVQWDKDDCADMGIVKVDLLGLGMMAALQDAIALINNPEGESLRSRPRDNEVGWASGGGAPRGKEKDTREGYGPSVSGVGVGPHAIRIDLAHLPQNDPAVYRLLCEADTIGVFQVESRAQMATLPRLVPKQFYDLVVQVAIIRPGPIVGQMVHPYLNRRAGREPVTYPHPSLEPILARTLGVPLFQEQLLRMAMVAAGFTGGQAEDLRRAFGFKRSERRMAQVEVQLREGMARQGITGDAAAQIITSITSFALYGFPESHAASFALLAYASAYLKVHYPAAFYTALLNNQPMGFYHPSTLVKDAQRRGIRFQPIDVLASEWDCTIEEDGSIRLGLRYVNGLRERVGRAIARLRPTRGRESTLEAEGQRSQVNERGWGPASSRESGREPLLEPEASICPKCGCDDASMLERTDWGWFCNVCSHAWPRGRESTLEAEGQRSRVNERGWGPASSRERGRESTLEAEGQRPQSATSCSGYARGLQPECVRPGGGAPGNKEEFPASSRERDRFASLDALIARTGLRRDEVVVLADIGALNSFGYDRRSALWQVERAVRPAGELFESAEAESLRSRPRRSEAGWASGSLEPLRSADARSNRGGGGVPAAAIEEGGAPRELENEAESLRSRPRHSEAGWASGSLEPLRSADARSNRGGGGVPAAAIEEGGAPREQPEGERLRSSPRDSEAAWASGGGAPRGLEKEAESLRSSPRSSPLEPMTEAERIVADYAGTGLTVGRHPMALRRDELALRGILRAIDLRATRHGRRVRVAGMVITRQRPGTAKGFVFLTLEDETGIANIIIRPDLFARERLVIIEEPFLLVSGVLQSQDGVISVRAETVEGLKSVDVDFDAHDFY